MKNFNSVIKRLKSNTGAYRDHVALMSAREELTPPAVLAYCDKIIAALASNSLTDEESAKLESAVDSLIGWICLGYEMDPVKPSRVPAYEWTHGGRLSTR